MYTSTDGNEALAQNTEFIPDGTCICHDKCRPLTPIVIDVVFNAMWPERCPINSLGEKSRNIFVFDGRAFYESVSLEPKWGVQVYLLVGWAVMQKFVLHLGDQLDEGGFESYQLVFRFFLSFLITSCFWLNAWFPSSLCDSSYLLLQHLFVRFMVKRISDIDDCLHLY